MLASARFTTPLRAQHNLPSLRIQGIEAASFGEISLMPDRPSDERHLRFVQQICRQRQPFQHMALQPNEPVRSSLTVRQ